MSLKLIEENFTGTTNLNGPGSNDIEEKILPFAVESHTWNTGYTVTSR